MTRPFTARHRREMLRTEALTEFEGCGLRSLGCASQEIFTSPQFLCVEVISSDDTASAMQDRLDDYLAFGVANIWVIDPSKHRGRHVNAERWAIAAYGVMRTSDRQWRGGSMRCCCPDR